MHRLLAALLAFIGLRLSILLGNFALNISFTSLPWSPDRLRELLLLGIPFTMLAAALLGWVLVHLWRSIPLGPVAMGLGLGTLLTFYGSLKEVGLQVACLELAGQALVALCFAAPAVLASGLLATNVDVMIYVGVVCMVLPPAALGVYTGVKMTALTPMPDVPAMPVFVPVAVDLRTAEGRRAAATPPSGISFKVSLEQAVLDGRIVPDPKLQALRVAVVSAGEELRRAPCDKLARSRLRGAVLNFTTEGLPLSDRPNIELFTAAGPTQQVTGKLDAPAGRFVSAALHAGIVVPDDLSLALRMLSKVQGFPPAPEMTSALRCP